MSRRSNGKYMTATMLKQRGWSSELLKELLPKPRIFHAGAHPVRAWDREDVQRAEQDPRFREGQLKGGRAKTASPQSKRACAALDRSFQSAERDDTAPWLLAGY